MTEHGLQQQANDWIMCKCGKIFGNSRRGRRTKEDKFFKHLSDENENNQEYICITCGEKLIGLKSVGNHRTEKNHYEYKIEGVNGVLGLL